MQLKQEAMQFIGQAIGLGPLKGVQQVEISQQPDYIECICPCFGETSNNYKLSQVSYLAEKIENVSNGAASLNIPLKEIGTIGETSGCCSRFCCQCWRSLELKFYSQNDQAIPYFYARRPYKIPAAFCCPCSRPEVEVYMNKGAPCAVGQDQANFIGSVKQPYFFCGRSPCPCPLLEEIDICDQDNNMRYFISGQFCQCGNLARMEYCPRCCGPCRFIEFHIYDPTKQKVGSITNIYNGCFTECYTKADKYKIDFPAQATEQDKVMIIIASLIIDYDVFESTCLNPP